MSRRAFQFGPFLLVPEARELRRAGTPVALPPKAFDTLQLLIEERDRALTKQALLDALWPDVAVEESSLSQQIFLVRRALEENGNGNRYVATIPRHGYRFVASVREIPDLPQQPQPSASRSPRKRTALLAGCGAVAVLLIGYSWWGGALVSRRERSSAPSFVGVTSSPQIESFPSLSPDGTTLVYAVGPLDYAGESDIFMKSVGGKTALNLTPDTPGADTQPAFSPSGEYIAFVSGRHGGTAGGIYVMGKMGDSVRPLTTSGFNPAWSPDGERIVFSSESVGADPIFRSAIRPGELLIVDVHTGETRRLGRGLQPRWSPHGQRIAYLDAGRVWTVRPDGTDARAVTATRPPASWNPVWTPDGSALYFCSDRGGTMNVWRVAIDERDGAAKGEPVAVTMPSTFVAHLSFSADGRRLAFASVPVTMNVRHFEFDPVTETIVREHPLVTSGAWVTAYPSPSPDGEWIAFHSAHWREDIWVIRRDGTGLRQLTDDDAADRVARWSPDGRTLSFYSDFGGKYRTWLIDADGGNRRPITSGEVPSLSLTWAPDVGKAALTEPGNRSYILDPRVPLEKQRLIPLPTVGGRVFRPTDWSPDGTKLTGVVEGTPGLSVLALATGEFTSVTTSGRVAKWLSDSRRLMVCDDHRLLIADSVTRRVKEVLSFGADLLCSPSAGGFDISRDGRHIYAAPSRREGDIWVATFNPPLTAAVNQLPPLF